MTAQPISTNPKPISCLEETRLQLTKLWNSGSYTAALKLLRDTDEEYALELMCIASVEVKPANKRKLLDKLGVSNDVEVMDIFDLKPSPDALATIF